ncbi:MAG: diguanylate cyclase [Nanoarchaeota archaeon]|nr:diguanylate cyclase [Nanoarchaeota archaeon]MBU1631587.1 diguanylate cyclase [Nanoarchaeota archaeon]MBU1876117.1 diguanylate cyclase [Nanoarchaeota archaeon]
MAEQETGSQVVDKEIAKVIKQIASISKKERKIIKDLPDFFRRRVLHHGNLSDLLNLLRKSIKEKKWADKKKISHLVDKLLSELDTRKGTIGKEAYKGTEYSELVQQEKELLKEEEKLTFDLYDSLQKSLDKIVSVKKTDKRAEQDNQKEIVDSSKITQKIREIQQRLKRTLEFEKSEYSMDTQIDVLLDNFRNLIDMQKIRVRKEEQLLNSLQELLEEVFVAKEINKLKELTKELNEELNDGKELIRELKEKFYEPLQSFIDEKFKVEERILSVLNTKRKWYHLFGTGPKLTRKDFVLDYHTMSHSPDEVQDYLAAIEELGPRYISSGLKKFIQKNRRMLIARGSRQKKGLKREIVLKGRDALTGAFNRGSMDEMLQEMIAVYQRYKTVFSLILIDIDYFKKFNDTYGHQEGDRILRNVAKTIMNKSREIDYVARYGGEEFVVLAPNTNKSNAKVLAEKLRLVVSQENQEPKNPKTGGLITVSIGVAECPSDATDGKSLLKKADEALYKAKETGRDRVVVA